MTTAPTMDVDVLPLLPLPQTVWDTIVQLIFEPTWELKEALIQIKSLSLVSESLRRACKNTVLRLDASRSLDAHIAALAKLPIAVEFLDLDDFYNREFALRSATFIKHSAQTLKHLSAAVTTTDTLANFPLLEHLKLHGQEAFPKLYPAVLNNLHNLKHLELVNYEHKLVPAEVPQEVLEKLETLTVRPHPNGSVYNLHGKGNLTLYSLNLKRLRLDGSFNDLQAVTFGPCPMVKLSYLLTTAEDILIEGGIIIIIFDVNSYSEGFRSHLQWAAAVLLHAPVTLKRLEFRTLRPEGLLFRGVTAAPFPLFVRDSTAGLRDALEELAPGGTYGDMQWEYSVENQSIFEVYCLRIWRNSIENV